MSIELPQPKNYIVDHYSVLGVPRNAVPNDIKDAFRTKIQQYHPDKYASLAPEFQQKAAFKTRILTEAFEILSNAETKTIYDQRLTQWTGPISKDGIPVIDISRQGSYSDEELNKLMEQSILQSGFDPNTFNFIEEQYRLAKNPSPELEEAYKSMLEKKNTALSLQESFRRDSLDLDGDKATRNNPPAEYLLETQNDIAESRVALVSEIDQTVQKLASGETLLLDSGGQQIKVTDKALTEFTEKTLQKYDAGAQELEKLAQQKQELIEERLKMVKGKYLSENTSSTQLVVCMQASERKSIWSGFQLKDDSNIEFFQVSIDDNLDALKAKGYSVIEVIHAEGLPIKEELNRAVIRHFEDRDEKTEGKTAN